MGNYYKRIKSKFSKFNECIKDNHFKIPQKNTLDVGNNKKLFSKFFDDAERWGIGTFRGYLKLFHYKETNLIIAGVWEEFMQEHHPYRPFFKERIYTFLNSPEPKTFTTEEIRALFFEYIWNPSKVNDKLFNHLTKQELKTLIKLFIGEYTIFY